MEKEFIYDCIRKEKKLKININELEKKIDIKNKIIISTNHPISFIKFKKDFQESLRFLDIWESIELELRRPLPKPRKLPGGRIIPPKPLDKEQMEKKTLIEIWRDIKEKGYEIEKWDFLKLYWYFYLSKNAIYENKSSDVDLELLMNTDLNNNIPFEEFGTIENENKKYNKNEIIKYFKENYDLEWFQNEKEKNKNEIERIIWILKNQKKNIQKLTSTKPLKSTFEMDLGSIINVWIETESTTGKIFNYLELNEEYPLANYKKFFKMRIDNGEFKDIKLEELNLENTLKIYDKEGQLNVYIENKENNVIFIQSIYTNNSIIHDERSLLEFLKLKDKIIKTELMGMIREFMIMTPETFDASIFSNLCMNDELFGRYIKVNDIEKISRNNHSVFIYFSENHAKENKEEDDKVVYVGGWNRITSRFGELTAILTPIQTKKNKMINVKITRSINKKTVENFKKILLKLMAIYNQLLPSQIELFKSLYENFEIYQPPIITNRKIDNESMNREIFTPYHYTRACQNPKPIEISAESSKKIRESEKILFPPEKYKTIEPKWYACKDKEYPFMGLIKLNNINHPFGYAPCCYKESKLENKKIMKDIENLIKLKHLNESTQNIPVTINDRKPLNTDKIINYMGQIGPLPNKILEFMQVIDPSLTYIRIGTSTWKYDSILGCLEYRHVKILNKKIIRSPQSIRRDILNFPLEIGLQQNFDIGVEGIEDILNDLNHVIEGRRFIRILEEYYNINLFIFKRISIGQTRDIFEFLQPINYKEYYFTFKNEIRKKPIVFIIENSGENQPFRYELIGHKKENDDIMYELECHETYEKLLLFIYKSFSSDKLITIPEETSLQKCRKLMTHQVIDTYGKVPMLIFSSCFPVLLNKFYVPFSLPSFKDKIKIPSSRKLHENFFEKYDINIEKIYFYKNYYIFHVKDFIDLYFIGTNDIDQRNKIEKLDPKFNIFINILTVLEKENIQFYQMKNEKRIVGIIENFCLYEFSKFVFENKNKISIYSISQIIDNFFELCVKFLPVSELDYSTIHDFSTRFYPNPIYDAKKKLKIDRSLHLKLHFFLKWFVINNSFQFDEYRKQIELSSYYLYTSDFLILPQHVIQNSIIPIKNYSSCPYQSVPLDLLIEPLDQLFYYYNPKCTPKNIPYLCMIFNNKNDGLRKISYFVEYKSFDIPDDYLTPLNLQYGRGFKKDDRFIWKSLVDSPQFWLFHSTVYIFFISNEFNF